MGEYHARPAGKTPAAEAETWFDVFPTRNLLYLDCCTSMNWIEDIEISNNWYFESNSQVVGIHGLSLPLGRWGCRFSMVAMPSLRKSRFFTCCDLDALLSKVYMGFIVWWSHLKEPLRSGCLYDIVESKPFRSATKLETADGSKSIGIMQKTMEFWCVFINFVGWLSWLDTQTHSLFSFLSYGSGSNSTPGTWKTQQVQQGDDMGCDRCQHSSGHLNDSNLDCGAKFLLLDLSLHLSQFMRQARPLIG